MAAARSIDCWMAAGLALLIKVNAAFLTVP
jgi:hypothetical protein